MARELHPRGKSKIRMEEVKSYRSCDALNSLPTAINTAPLAELPEAMAEFKGGKLLAVIGDEVRGGGRANG